MAGKKSLPDVSQKVIADAEQYINEFKRAARAQKQSTSEMEKEMDRLGKSLGKKFGAADIGKDLLRGFGLGSGFAVADLAITKVVDLMRDNQRATEEAAKSVAELNKQYHELSRATAALGLRDKTPAAQLAAGQEDIEKTQREINAISAQMAKLNADMSQVATGQGTTNLPATYGYFTGSRGMADKIATKLDEQAKALVEKYGELNKQKEHLAAINKTIATDEEKEAARALAQAIALVEQEGDYTSRRLAAQEDKNNSAVNDAAKETADRSKEIAKDDLDFFLGVQGAKHQAVQAEIDTELRILREADEKRKTMDREMQHEVHRFADAFGDTWVDAINGVEGAWSDLGDAVVRQIERMIAQVLIVTPLMHGIGAIFGSFGGTGMMASLAAAFTGYHAKGGTVGPGEWGIAGEDGPEPVFGGTSGMTVLPNSSMKGGGGGGNTYYVDARGADAGVEQRVFAALKAVAGPGVTEQRALGAVSNHIRRGGQLG